MMTSAPNGAGEHVVKKSKFTEDQIGFALKQAELGTSAEEVCRKMGISEATFYL
jgi:putative transposase